MAPELQTNKRPRSSDSPQPQSTSTSATPRIREEYVPFYKAYREYLSALKKAETQYFTLQEYLDQGIILKEFKIPED